MNGVANMKIYGTKDGAAEFYRLRSDENAEGLIVNIPDQQFIASGMRRMYADGSDISAYNADYNGGSVVMFVGDLNIIELKKGFSDIGERVIGRVKEYLSQKGIETSRSGNDLVYIVNDYENNKITQYKVASFGSLWIGERMETVVHVSINVDVDLIRKICLKPMKKVPKGLSDFGITAEEVLAFISPIYE